MRNFHGPGKPTVAIYHGPIMLVNVALLDGKRTTCFWDVMIMLLGRTRPTAS